MKQTDDGWVVLGFDAVDGRMPHLPWRPDELSAVLAAYADVAEALGPTPDSFAEAGLEKFAESESDFSFWRQRACGMPPRLPGFMLARWIGPLAELEADWRAATVGDSVMHHDLRADNILIDRTERP